MALSIIFGVTRFQQYLFGRHFTLLTDHKPLIYLFHPHRSVPQMVSARIQRWSLILGEPTVTIFATDQERITGTLIVCHLPLSVYPKQVPVPGDVIFTLTELQRSMITAKDISVGWPNFLNRPELHPYFSKRNELSAESGCIFRGSCHFSSNRMPY